MTFISGILASIVALILAWLCRTQFWPSLQDSVFYRGIRVDGEWNIIEIRNGTETAVGRMTLKQRGARVTGRSQRTQTREGLNSNRQFKYTGRIAGDQLTLLFEDARGYGFDSGSYIFRLHNDCNTMHGIATFNGKKENQIMSEARILRRTV